MKRPSFQFYPGDWLNDAALRTCSVAARGLWIEMLCLMHQGSDYGYLKVNHRPILPVNLSRISGATLEETEGYLDELAKAGVYAVDGDGCIYSKRMIRDENIREKRASGGVLGGNPALKNIAQKVMDKDNLNANLQPTPSSSSSSSSSDKNTVPTPDGVSDSVWKDFKKLRTSKKSPITKTAMDGINREVLKAGITLEAALSMCCERGWTGFKAEWLQNKTFGQQNPAIAISPAVDAAAMTREALQKRDQGVKTMPPDIREQLNQITRRMTV